MRSPSAALVRGVGQQLYSKRVPALGNAFLYHEFENTIVTWSAQPTLRWQVQASSAAPLRKDRARRINSAGYDTPNQKQIPHNLERVAVALQFYNAFTIQWRSRGPSIRQGARNESLVVGTQNKDKFCSQNPMTNKSESELQFMFDFGERIQGKMLFTCMRTALPLHPWRQLPRAESNS